VNIEALVVSISRWLATAKKQPVQLDLIEMCGRSFLEGRSCLTKGVTKRSKSQILATENILQLFGSGIITEKYG